VGVGQHGVEARQSQLTHYFTTALLHGLEARQSGLLGVGQLRLERRSGHANYFSTTPQRSSISFQLGRKYLIAACIVNYGALSTENTASKCSPVKKSGFWVDGFIETACLRVSAIAVPSFLSPLRFKTPLENRKKGIQIYTVVFFSKIKDHTEDRYVD
jgi:hypothetical protein